MSTILENLLALEKGYSEKVELFTEALKSVRVLINLEKGVMTPSLPPLPALNGNGSHGVVRHKRVAADGIAGMTKGDAAEALLKTMNGSALANHLFQMMKKVGHPVASYGSLVSMLSSDPRFGSDGKGVWSLVQRDFPARVDHPEPEPEASRV